MRTFLVVLLVLGLGGCRKSLHDLNTAFTRQPPADVAKD